MNKGEGPGSLALLCFSTCHGCVSRAGASNTADTAVAPLLSAQLPPMVLPTEEKVLLAVEPRVVMAVMHTTMIRANITAYSTAVGPSSFLMKFTNAWLILRMVKSLL